MKILNPKWKDVVQQRIKNGEPIDITTSFKLAQQYLVTQLALSNIPFQVCKLGIGVVRITTETDVCPMCKQKLPKHFPPNVRSD